MWKEKDGPDVYRVIPSASGVRVRSCLGEYKSRSEFDSAFAKCERIEPIPPQCVPGNDEPCGGYGKNHSTRRC